MTKRTKPFLIRSQAKYRKFWKHDHLAFSEFRTKGVTMCDYSLFAIRNRLTEEGEELVVHRFETGARGIELQANRERRKSCLWFAIKDWVSSVSSTSVPAICIPPWARLLLTNVPQSAQESLRIGPSETAVFTEISSRSYSYRDTLILSNGTQVLLQDLAKGTRAVVLSLSSDASEGFATEELQVTSRYKQTERELKLEI